MKPLSFNLWRLDAVFRHQLASVGVAGRDAGGGDGFVALDLGGDFKVQRQQLGEQILLRVEPVGCQNGVERFC